MLSAGDFNGKVFLFNLAAGTEHECMFNGIGQLPDISGPIIFHEGFQGRCCHAGNGSAGYLVIVLNKVVD